MAKPRANIYTVLLALALVAVLMGCLFLLLEYRRYGAKGGAGSQQQPVLLARPEVDQPRFTHFA